MNLTALAASYRSSASLIGKRISELSRVLEASGLCETEKFRMRGRLVLLRSMYRDTCGVAHALEHYYDRSANANEHRI